MADLKQSIFNKRAAEKLRSPDDLDKYIRVTNPSVWVVLAACIALLAGLLTWGFLGAVATNISATGTLVSDTGPVCFLSADDAAKVHEGDPATVGGEQMFVWSIAKTPVSKAEARDILQSDYLVSTLVKGDWAYPVYFTSLEEEDEALVLDVGVPLPVSITVERTAPISLVLGGRK